MNKSIIIFVCDAWHTKTSMQFIGNATNIDRAIMLIREYITKYELASLKDYDIEMLKTISQTQGLNSNFIIEEIEVNKLYE